MLRDDVPHSVFPAPRGALYLLIGRYLPDLIYGANDGIITTLAVVSGVTGAALSSTVILILGFANLVAPATNGSGYDDGSDRSRWSQFRWGFG